MDSLSRMYGVDPVRMNHLIKFIMAFVSVQLKEGKTLRQAEDLLLKSARVPKTSKGKSG